jgi:hypothetical protein
MWLELGLRGVRSTANSGFLPALAVPGSQRKDGTGLGSRIALSIGFQIADAPSQSRGGFRPSFAMSFARFETKGRREGRAPAAPEIRALQKCTRGGSQVMPVARPSLRGWF